MEQNLTSPAPSNNEPHKVPQRVGRRWIRQSIGIVISVICLVVVFQNVNPHSLLLALMHFDWIYLVIGVASLGLGYSMRIIRWGVMLRAGGGKVSNLNCAAPFLGSIALNNVLPLRAGDVIRALVFPAALGISRITATASLLLERLVDLLTLLICLGLGMALDRTAVMPTWLHDVATTLSIAGSATLLMVIFGSSSLVRLLRLLSGRMVTKRLVRLGAAFSVAGDLAARINEMSRPGILSVLLSLSLFVWACELGLYVCLLGGMGLGFGASAGLILLSMATLATLVPSSPGYVGPFHLAAAAAVEMLGGSNAQAASLSIIAHLSVWLPTTLAGATAMLLNRRLFQRAHASSTPDQNQFQETPSMLKPNDHH